MPLAATVLWKSFDALASKILPLVEFSVLARVAVIFVSDNCVMLLAADTPKVPVVVTSTSSILFASTRLISLPLAATVLLKSFAALASRILPLVEFSVLARAAVIFVPVF